MGADYSASYKRYALTVLFLLYTLNFLDRQIVNIVAEPIKKDMGLSDWQLGSLTGLAFALFYATLALPIARLAERKNRVKIVAFSAIVWSGFTALCGLGQSFLHLFLARVGVGVGEAGCTPASHSLITDYFSREKRASAMATFSLGIPAGSLVGMAIGGLIADSFGWRAAFIVVGIPGLLLGLIALVTLREPRTHNPVASHTDSLPGVWQALKDLKGNRTYVWLTAAMAAMAFVTYGHFAFLSSFFLRNHADNITELSHAIEATTGIALGPMGFLGVSLGIIFGLFGALGTWLGGVLSDRGAARDMRAYALIPAFSALILPLSLVATYLAPGAGSALLMLCVPMLLQSIYYGPLFASVQSLVEPNSRATAAAILLFFANLIGLGLGPLTVGTLSDVIAVSAGPADGIRWALIITGFIYLAAALAFFKASRTIRDAIVS
ncbi:spinster family MFS transporter [Alloalcanivorax sp. C16-1]|uniref:spinster family MFS transporter n=1 Tax=Alloalcanivorax sp. C16-1 TaxID=3390051 RepID=UPI003970C68A